ncbi:MAG: hypothetical protein U1E31_01055 [Rickettsiales bacterium]
MNFYNEENKEIAYKIVDKFLLISNLFKEKIKDFLDQFDKSFFSLQIKINELNSAKDSIQAPMTTIERIKLKMQIKSSNLQDIPESAKLLKNFFETEVIEEKKINQLIFKLKEIFVLLYKYRNLDISFLYENEDIINEKNLDKKETSDIIVIFHKLKNFLKESLKDNALKNTIRDVGIKYDVYNFKQIFANELYKEFSNFFPEFILAIEEKQKIYSKTSSYNKKDNLSKILYLFGSITEKETQCEIIMDQLLKISPIYNDNTINLNLNRSELDSNDELIKNNPGNTKSTDDSLIEDKPDKTESINDCLNPSGIIIGDDSSISGFHIIQYTE